MKKMVLINIITIVALVIIGVVGFYFYHNATSYVTTDNAKVDGNQIKIASPASGQIKSLTQNKASIEKRWHSRRSNCSRSRWSNSRSKIKMPQDGTIAKTDGMEGSIAQAGSPIAYAYNLDDLYITANIDENDLSSIDKGDKVDVTIDGQDSKIDGKIKEIGKATANSFSLMPSSNSDGNYTKVSQVIPVKISLDSQPSKNVVPGMNAEVKIHKD